MKKEKLFRWKTISAKLPTTKKVMGESKEIKRN